MTLEELVGSRFVFGIPGTTITPDIVQHFRDTHAGGLILYRINFESPDQLRKLISDLENALGRRLLVTCDHEGGRVIMFRDGITVFPSNQALGKTGNTHRSQNKNACNQRPGIGSWAGDCQFEDLLISILSQNLAGIEKAHLADGHQQRCDERIPSQIRPPGIDDDRKGNQRLQRNRQQRINIFDIAARNPQLSARRHQ